MTDKFDLNINQMGFSSVEKVLDHLYAEVEKNDQYALDKVAAGVIKQTMELVQRARENLETIEKSVNMVGGDFQKRMDNAVEAAAVNLATKMIERKFAELKKSLAKFEETEAAVTTDGISVTGDTDDMPPEIVDIVNTLRANFGGTSIKEINVVRLDNEEELNKMMGRTARSVH